MFLVVPAALALGWAATVAAADDQKFPATGQTTCYDSAGTVIACAGTGQNGDIQAGATMDYEDNGNGTITKLVWEKKSADFSIHDVDTFYTWHDAFAVHVATLNTIERREGDLLGQCRLCGGGWRVRICRETRLARP